jgi:hypothetical protein
MKPNEVDAFMRALDHPLKAEIEAVRTIIRGADATITEGIKWNAPSFRTTEWFATVNLRAKGGVGVILHLGAKVKPKGWTGMQIDDPAGLLTWLGKDRASVKFADLKAIKAQKKALESIFRQWIAHVG